jgi:hypothetical protein
MNTLGEEVHEYWRTGIEKQYESEGKPKDTERMRNQPGYEKSNINVPFDKLTPEWKLDNVKAGALALDVVLSGKSSSDAIDADAGARLIHAKWMQRNPLNENNAYNHKPFDELPENEKDKDRAHLRIASDLLNALLEEVNALFPSCSVDRAIRHIRVSFEIVKNMERI